MPKYKCNDNQQRSSDMKSFCREFFKYDQEEPHDIDNCPQCKEAYDEEVRFNRIEQEEVDGGGEAKLLLSPPKTN